MASEQNREPSTQQINQNPGILLEELKSLATTTTTWKIVKKINLEPFFNQGMILLKAGKTISENCPKEKCIYQKQLDQLQNQIHDALLAAQRISGMIENQDNHKRVKRSWFAGIGKASKFLFGTLDEDSETELKEIIKISTNDTKQLANLVANQTELIAAEFGAINTKTGNLETAINKMEEKQNDITENSVIAVAVELLTDNVLQYELDIEILTDAILFATQGIIHPKLISPEQIENSAVIVSNTVPDATFPAIKNEKSITEITKISNVVILISKFQLIYQVSVPLMDHTRYTLYRAVPVPIHQQSLNITNAFAYIWPESPYFALSKTLSAYMPMTVETLHDCKKLYDLYTCKNLEPVRSINENTPCEVRLATNKNVQDLTSCKIKIVKLNETYWAHTDATNTWIYSTSKSENIFINCKRSYDYTLTIAHTGILKLPSGCTARTNSIRLTASREIVTTTTATIFNNTKLDIMNILKNINITHPNFIQNIVNNTKSLKEMSPQSNSLARSLETGHDFHDIITKAKNLGQYQDITYKFHEMQSNFTYSGIATILIVVILIALWKFRTCGGSRLLKRNRLVSGNHHLHQHSTQPTVIFHPQSSSTPTPRSLPPNVMPSSNVTMNLPSIQYIIAENRLNHTHTNQSRDYFGTMESINSIDSIEMQTDLQYQRRE